LAASFPVVALAVLTMLGERRRSRSWAVVVLAGMFFPLAWTAWYLRDGLGRVEVPSADHPSATV